MGSYIPTTAKERDEMLAAVGLQSLDGLFAELPRKVVLPDGPEIPAGLSELSVRRALSDLAEKNTVYRTCFRGAGAYRHYIPEIVKSVTGKEEFLTAYTPYQAEISQGILQSIFEYQTMICRLTGMESSNASLYDGASAAAEAAAMCRDKKRGTVLVSAAVHPDTFATIKTYCFGNGAELLVVPEKDGATDLDFVKAHADEKTACLCFQQPNYYGVLEDAQALCEAAHAAGAKAIAAVNPISLAVLKTPAEYGADIAVGEGQPLGMPLSFGGPYLGFMACTQAMTRKMPGRIVGETTDVDGKRGFVLTLQAREQHIKRERASSNVCSNQALCAMTAAVYLAAMGAQGLREAAVQSASKAAYLQEALEPLGYRLACEKPFFHEFVTVCPIPAKEAEARLAKEGVLSGLPLDEHRMLWCCTELNTKEEMDAVAAILKGGAGV